MASAPIFTGTPKIGIANISTANTNRDGTGTVDTVFTAGASGSRIEHIDILGVGTTTAGMVRLFLYDGSTYRLWKEVAITAVTASASVAGFSYSINTSLLSNCLILPTGWSLRASTHNAETFNVIALGGDF